MKRLRKIPTAFLASQVDGELILVHGKSGAFYSLKDVGLAIWHELDGESDLARVTTKLSEEYEISPDECRASIDRFASELVDAGFAEYA